MSFSNEHENRRLANNSTDEFLLAGETYTGEWTNCINYSSVVAAVNTDADGFLYMQFSSDGVNIDSSVPYRYEAGVIYQPHRLTIGRPFFRAVYVNGDTDQTYFRLVTMVGDFTLLATSADANVSRHHDCLVVRSIPSEVDLALGRMQGIELIEKFGRNTDVDTATAPETIWAPGGTYTGQPTSNFGTIDVSSDSADDTLGGAGAEVIVLFGLDENFIEQEETIILNGTTVVTTTNTWSRMPRMRVIQSNNGANDTFNVGVISAVLTSDSAVVFARMPIGFNQTTIGAYTVPANKTFILKFLTIDMAANSSSTAEAAIYVRRFEQAPQLTFPGTLRVDVPYVIQGPVVLPEKTDIRVKITSVTNNNTGFTTRFIGQLARAV